jgi:hypothetical protein
VAAEEAGILIGDDRRRLPDQLSANGKRSRRRNLKDDSTMNDTPMPVTGFALDVAMSEDGQTMVALLTLETGELAFEFAINKDVAQAMVGNLQQFLDMVQWKG